MIASGTVNEFEVLLDVDGDGFHVWCPALPGCHSFGVTVEEAKENIKEAIELWLDDSDEQEILRREHVAVTVP